MGRYLGPVAALLASVAILQLGNGLQGTLLPLRAQLEQFSTLSVGLLAANFFLGFTAGCFFGPQLVRLVGHIRAYAAMTAIASAAILCHALIVVALPWWIMRAVMGFSFAVLYLVIESWLNERSTNETRGVVLSAYLIIHLTVVAFGQLMVLLYDPSGSELFLLASLLMSIAAVPVALTLSPAPAPPERVTVDLKALYRVSPAGSVACFANGLTNGAFWGLAPVFVGGPRVDVAATAVFMSVTVIGGAIGQWPLGRLSDAMDRRRVLIGAALIAAAAGVVLNLLSPDSAWLFPATAVWGAMSFPIYAIAVAHTNDCTSAEEFVGVASGLLLLYGSGAAIGPFLAGAVMEATYAGGLYLFTSLGHLVLAGFIVNRMRVGRVVEEAERVPFTESLEAAQAISEALRANVGEQALERLHEQPSEAR